MNRMSVSVVRRLVLLLLAVLLSSTSSIQAAGPQRAQAQQGIADIGFPTDGTFRVYESTFNELAAAVMPLQLSGEHPQRITKKIGVCPFCYTIDVKLCGGEWDAEVAGLDFEITGDNIRVSGVANTTYHCVVSMSFSTDFSSDVQVEYDRDLQLLTVATGSEQIQPYFDVSIAGRINLGRIYLPTIIDPGPSLTLPPIQVTAAKLEFATARGPAYLLIGSDHVSLRKRDGYVEIRGNVNGW